MLLNHGSTLVDPSLWHTEFGIFTGFTLRTLEPDDPALHRAVKLFLDFLLAAFREIDYFGHHASSKINTIFR